MDAISHGPDVRPHLQAAEGHSVPQSPTIIDINSTLDTGILQLRQERSRSGQVSPTIEKGRRAMLQDLADIDKTQLRDSLSHLKGRLVDEDGSRTLKYGKENYDFALINDAVASSDIPGIQTTLSALESPTINSDGPMAIDAPKQLCYTLVRQLKELKKRDPHNPELLEIRRRLRDIKESPFTHDIIKEYQLNLPLAVLEDPDALKAVESRYVEDSQSIEYYANRRFNLKTLKWDQIKQAVETKNPDEERLLQEVREDLSSEENSRPLTESEPEPENLSEQERLKRRILEGLRTPDSITSDNSSYDSPMRYEIPDPERLWHYLEKGDFQRDFREYYQEYRGTMPIGPEVGELGENPVIVYNRGSLELLLDTKTDKNATLSSVFTPELIEKFQQTVGDRLPTGAKIFVDRLDSTLRMRFPHDRVQAGIANLSDGKLRIYVHNLLRSPFSGVDSPEDLGLGLQNALELHRVLMTEMHKEADVDRRSHGESLQGMPSETVVIDPFWDRHASQLSRKAA